MKLKTAAKLEKVAIIIIWLIKFPFELCHVLLEFSQKPFEWVMDKLESTRWEIGHWLLLKSNVVKDVKNKEVLRNGTALYVDKRLKKERT